MSKRKQKLNPIDYKEAPPLWQLMQEKARRKEEAQQKKLKEEPVIDYDEMLVLEAERAEKEEEEAAAAAAAGHHEQIASVTVEEEYQTEAEEVVEGSNKNRTREFVEKEVGKLLSTLDDLIEEEAHSFVVNFVVDMSGKAKKKLYEMRRLSSS